MTAGDKLNSDRFMSRAVCCKSVSFNELVIIDVEIELDGGD
jgi:hypothetical protein